MLEEISREIKAVKKELEHGVTEEPRILEVRHDKREDRLTIVAADRGDKSIIIGKGGWVVGKLRERLGYKKISVVAYTDLVIREFRRKESLKAIESARVGEEAREFFDNCLRGILEAELKGNEFRCKGKYNVALALSGGTDSSGGLLLLERYGVKPKAVTVDPGTAVLPRKMRENIENVVGYAKIEHEFIDIDIFEIIDGASKGRFHPCGRCSKVVKDAVYDYCKKEGLSVVIFGDLLSTGSQCINIIDEKLVRVNLPGMLAKTKAEMRGLIESASIEYNHYKYGCPLLRGTFKKHPKFMRFSIQRVLREVRAGILEPGEGMREIQDIVGLLQ